MLNSFVYFDEKGTELSLWVNSVSGGMFSIPLNIAQGVVCALPYYANTALLEQRFGIITAMLPPPTQSKAANDFVQVICKNTNKADFLYTVSQKTNFKISVSIAPSESNSVIYIKVI